MVLCKNEWLLGIEFIVSNTIYTLKSVIVS